MNILFIGLGSIAKKHISAIQTILPESKLFAFRSSKNSKKVTNIISIYNKKELYGYKFDFVIISNPTSKHKDTIKLALELHCPIFIEKPLYHKLDIQKLLEEIKNKKILSYVACNLRFLDVIRKIKKEIEKNDKKINEINVYCGSYLPLWRKDKNYKESYSASKKLGGGVQLDLIHEIDYIFWIFGVPIKTNKILKNNSHLNIQSFDYANYCLEYDNFCVSIILNYYRFDAKRTIEILFDEETWSIDLLKNEIKIGEKIIYKSEQKIVDTYYLQMKYFIDLVKSKKTTSFNDVFEAYKVLKISI